jgi:hypothetical protein
MLRNGKPLEKQYSRFSKPPPSAYRPSPRQGRLTDPKPVNSLGTKPEELGPKIDRRGPKKSRWCRGAAKSKPLPSFQAALSSKAAIMTAQTCFQITQCANFWAIA